MANQEISFVNHICYPPCSEKSWQNTDKNSDHLVLKRKFYWKTAIHWCIIFACLCATTAKVSSCNRHSIAHKAYNIFYLDLREKQNFTESCPKQKEVHRAQWWKDNASQSGEKSRGWRGRGEHRGDAERKGWARWVCRGGHAGDTERGAGLLGHLRWRSGLRRQHIPSEKISRNLQTWVQILICVEQLLKPLFSFVCPDGPESLQRRC